MYIVEPSMPHIPGLEIASRVMHSSDFKSRADFGNSKHVMILGAGETAMDISYMAVTSPKVKSVTLCHRDGFVYAPKVFFPVCPYIRSLTAIDTINTHCS